MNLSKKNHAVVYCGLFAALAIILYFFEIPMIPPFSYLKFDFSDIPAVVAACLFGPAAGISVELIKNVIHVVIRGFADTMGYGDIMNFLVGCAYVVPFSLIYRRNQARRNKLLWTALLGGASGLVIMAAVGLAGNYLLAPLYFKALMHVTLGTKELWAAISGATVLNIFKSVLMTVSASFVLLFTRRHLRQNAA